MERRELIPGYLDTFTETGIDGDAVNVCSVNHVLSLLGDFEKMSPIKHYGEYFREQDKKYEQAGKPGLYKAVMEKSNPATVAAFDRLVDEFNNKLPSIIGSRDQGAVKEFVDSVYALKVRVSED